MKYRVQVIEKSTGKLVFEMFYDTRDEMYQDHKQKGYAFNNWPLETFSVYVSCFVTNIFTVPVQTSIHEAGEQAFELSKELL